MYIYIIDYSCVCVVFLFSLSLSPIIYISLPSFTLSHTPSHPPRLLLQIAIIPPFQIHTHSTTIPKKKVDESKLCKGLGPGFPLPVEITPFCHEHTIRTIAALPSCVQRGRCNAILRMGTISSNKPDGDAVAITDNGNYIVDLHFTESIEDPPAMAMELKNTVGVVDHGLFCGMTTAGEGGYIYIYNIDYIYHHVCVCVCVLCVHLISSLFFALCKNQTSLTNTLYIYHTMCVCVCVCIILFFYNFYFI